MYTVSRSRRFTRSFRKLQRSGLLKPQVLTEFVFVVNSLRDGVPLHEVYRDHALTGEWLGYRECHIKGDLLLMYQIRDDRLVLVLADIGSHSYLFG